MHTLTKINIKKNINYQLKIMKVFGRKKEKGLIGLSLIKKLKMSNIVRLM